MAYGYGPGCSLVNGSTDPGCTSFHVFWADRRPAEVARVEIETVDMKTTEADVNDGYIAFDYTAALPDGYDIDADGMMMDTEVFRQITFFAADGSVLAREDFTDQQYRRNGEEREPLDRYPSLTADEIS